MLLDSEYFIPDLHYVFKECEMYFYIAAFKHPVFIEAADQNLLLCNTDFVQEMLENLPLLVKQHRETDGSITLNMEALNLTVTKKTLGEAQESLVNDLIAYANKYFNDFESDNKAPEPQDQIPYVFKILTAGSRQDLQKALVLYPEKD